MALQGAAESSAPCVDAMIVLPVSAMEEVPRLRRHKQRLMSVGGSSVAVQ